MLLRFKILFLLGLSTFMAAQEADSLALFDKITYQYAQENTLVDLYYYNPANKPDYSALSFAEVKLAYQNADKESYLLQKGSGVEGLFIEASSYKKLKKNITVWGTADYSNFRIKELKWNENIDFSRIGPYVTADSVGGTMHVENYHFQGGIAKTIARWKVGLEGSYRAKMAFRARDPRAQNTSSDLQIKLGLSYSLYQDFSLGAFAQFNKYTQNSSVSFASEVSWPIIYHLTGLGFTNHYFNQSPQVMYEEYAYRVGAQLAKSGGKNFYLLADVGTSENTKSIYPENGNQYYEASQLKKKTYTFEGAKFLTLGQHKLGILARYRKLQRTGDELGYSDNTQNPQLLYQRESYQKKDERITIKGLWQLKSNGFTLAGLPFYTYQKITEQRLYPYSGQKIVAHNFGLAIDFKKKINKGVVSITPRLAFRQVAQSLNKLNLNLRPSIKNWLLSDFQHLASNSTTFSLSARYDFQLKKLPALFAAAHWGTQAINHKNNNFVGLSLGATF